MLEWELAAKRLRLLARMCGIEGPNAQDMADMLRLVLEFDTVWSAIQKAELGQRQASARESARQKREAKRAEAARPKKRRGRPLAAANKRTLQELTALARAFEAFETESRASEAGGKRIERLKSFRRRLRPASVPPGLEWLTHREGKALSDSYVLRLIQEGGRLASEQRSGAGARVLKLGTPADENRTRELRAKLGAANSANPNTEVGQRAIEAALNELEYFERARRAEARALRSFLQLSQIPLLHKRDK